VNTCAGEMSGRFQELEKAVQEAHATSVAQDEPWVSVWGLMEKYIFGSKFYARVKQTMKEYKEWTKEEMHKKEKEATHRK
jgi:hypothetical protein